VTDAPHPWADLAGTWRGSGEGSYPTIEDFAYREELVIEPVPGRPLAHWRSRTQDASSGEPRHAESGFLRMTPAGPELVIAHGFGVVEAATGTFGDGVLLLATTSVSGTPSAKAVADVRRHIAVDGDTLRYDTSMAAVGVDLTHHLRAVLQRNR
jgi:hypothetical protein